MNPYKLFYLSSALVLFSSSVSASDIDCLDDNRTEQGQGIIIDGICVDPPTLPYPERPDCGDDMKLVQSNDNNCTDGVLAPDPGSYPPRMNCPAGKTIDQNTKECTIDGVATTNPLPANLTIDSISLEKEIASIFDDTPYNPAIDVQGVIDSKGLIVSIPYTVVTSPVKLLASSTSITLNTGVTEDGESGIIATLAWKEQASLPVGTGSFIATITIDDSAGNNDGIYKAKQLDLEDNSEGLFAAIFPYAVDNMGREGNLTLKIIPGIKDRMFGLLDNTNNNTTHMFLYIPVTNPSTGRTWLNNNLGANYANINSLVFNPQQQAVVFDDRNAFGSFFQWGRKADGHELINWTGIPVAINGTTSTKNDNPTDALYIIGSVEWRVHVNDTLWSSESNPNNVCPLGYRIPTEDELNAERNSWESQNRNGALSSPLALTVCGNRSGYDGTIHNYGTSAFYWTSTGVTYTRILRFGQFDAYMDLAGRATGHPVRCIKD